MIVSLQCKNKKIRLEEYMLFTILSADNFVDFLFLMTFVLSISNIIDLLLFMCWTAFPK